MPTTAVYVYRLRERSDRSTNECFFREWECANSDSSNCRSVYCVVNVLTVSEYKVLPEASATAPTVSVY